MRLLPHKLILLLLTCCSLQPLHVAAQARNVPVATRQQDAQPVPSDAQWQQLAHDKAFDYANEKELEKDKPENKPQKPGVWADIFNMLYQFFVRKGGSAILWAGVFIVIGYAIYRVFIGEKSFIFRKSRKQSVQETGKHIEEDLLETNWEQRLRTAYEQADLRLAIRYSYMWLLQLMQERELIQYRNDKTNHDYYYELAETPYKQPFRQLTREYEFAWYGHYPVSNNAYQDYMRLFNDIKTRLN